MLVIGQQSLDIIEYHKVLALKRRNTSALGVSPMKL